MKINYCKAGQAVPDADAETYLMINKDIESMISVSTSNVILMARVLLKRKAIISLELYYENEFVDEVDKDGRMGNWPKGFCDFDENCYMEILEWS